VLQDWYIICDSLCGISAALSERLFTALRYSIHHLGIYSEGPRYVPNDVYSSGMNCVPWSKEQNCLLKQVLLTNCHTIQ